MGWGFIDSGTNPLSLVRVKGVSRRQKEPRVLNSAEIQTLIANLENPCRTAVIVALGTGLRCSELFALKWEDINWDDLTLSVHWAIVDGVVGDVKTKYSLSGLPLDPALAEVLLNWKRASQFGQKADWIFASPIKLENCRCGQLQCWKPKSPRPRQLMCEAGLAGIPSGIPTHRCCGSLE